MPIGANIVRVAIAAGSEKRRRILKFELEKKGALEIIACTALTEAFLHQLSPVYADVLLVDLHDEGEPDQDLFHKLLDINEVPIVFNDPDGEIGMLTQVWVDRLVDKLVSLAMVKAPTDTASSAGHVDSIACDSERTTVSIDTLACQIKEAMRADGDEQQGSESHLVIESVPTAAPTGFAGLAIDFEEEMGVPMASSGDAKRKLLPTQVQPKAEYKRDTIQATTVSTLVSGKNRFLSAEVDANAQEIQAKALWVLGASIGGPQAVKEFLSDLPDNLGLAFMLVQHIGSNFVDLLAEQLENSTLFRVRQACQGSCLQAQQVLIAPADLYLSFDENRSIKVVAREKTSIYNPCIDDVLEEVTRYWPGANVIIFSGMGDDGARGVATIAKAGGTVWAQDAESCIVSSMPDCARAKGVVSFSGTAAAMAAQLIDEQKKTDPFRRTGVR